MDRGAWWATVYGLQRVGHNPETFSHAKGANISIDNLKKSALGIKPQWTHKPFL